VSLTKHAIVVAVVGAALLATTACGSDDPIEDPGGVLSVDAAVLPPESALVLVVNPSSRAHALVFKHAREILAAVARPRMSVVGLYQQHSSDDGAPFDRAFMSTSSPRPLRPPPPLHERENCSGPGVKKTRCHKTQDRKETEALDARGTWRRELDERVQAWRDEGLRTLEELEASNVTEESPDGLWDLRGALLNAGTNLQALDAPVQCVVLLGGLAVKAPPASLPTEALANSTLIVAGWRGTLEVQEGWQNVLTAAGIKIEFLPQAVTGLELVSRVKECLASEPGEDEVA
jgi:hypothetical protein